MDSSKLKVAIVHDWFVGGGAEKVVLALHELYPQAPIYTSYIRPEWRQKLAPAPIITGYLQHWPFSSLRKFLPLLRRRWFSKLDLKDFDLVISSSGAEAKGVSVHPGAIHINYCHAPTHYYWQRYDQYLNSPGFGMFDPLARLALRLLVGPSRKWDYAAAQHPDVMIANSNYIRDMIKKYYGRDSTVIHPPVDVELFTTKTSLPRNGYIVAGRQTPYKRIDLAVKACSQLGLPLCVIGTGPDHKKLVSVAGPTVTFLEHVGDIELPLLFQTAEAFIFPNVDDFGITAVEALAAGTPVIAFQGGGALDYIEAGKTGDFFDKQTVSSLTAVLNKFKPKTFDNHKIAHHAQQFSIEHFKKHIQAFIDKQLLKP